MIEVEKKFLASRQNAPRLWGMKIGVALGSNLGDSLSEMTEARIFLKGLSPHYFIASSNYSSSPVDCAPESNVFINAVVEIEFSDGLLYLLEKLQAYESERGRLVVRERNSPRPIDLDILYAADLVMHTARLTLPHPRWSDRLFVLDPLAEICPELVIPHQTKTVRVLLEELRSQAHDQSCHKIV